jgi:hypothetical protein
LALIAKVAVFITGSLITGEGFCGLDMVAVDTLFPGGGLAFENVWFTRYFEILGNTKTELQYHNHFIMTVAMTVTMTVT